MPSLTGLLSLPNEVLIQILSPFSTTLLLDFALVSARFYDVVLYIFHSRLSVAASLRHHKLILECYHPATKNTEPYLFCDYLGTPGLTHDEAELHEHSEADKRRSIGKLTGYYSRFCPIRPEEEGRIFLPHPAGGLLPGPAVGNPIFTSEPGPSEGRDGDHLVSHNVNLDPEEPFSQLCVVTNLVKLGPRRGVFVNCVNVSDGFVRLRRDWMKEAAEVWTKQKVKDKDAGIDGFNTLWLDSGMNIGLKVRMTDKSFRRQAPVLTHKEEDPAVSYSMEYEELLVRTTRLLLAVEEALLQDRNEAGGKALIFGNFTSRSI